MCFFLTQMNEPNMYYSVFFLWPSLISRDVNIHLVRKKKQKKTDIWAFKMLSHPKFKIFFGTVKIVDETMGKSSHLSNNGFPGIYLTIQSWVSLSEMYC